MQLKSQISAVIALAALIWGIYLYFSGQDLSWKMVAPFGVTVSGVTLISIAFIKHLWRWNIFRRWLVERPDIAGTWKGRLKSSYTEGGQPVEKTVFVVIRQTLTSLSFRLYSEKARSFSLADSLSKDEPDLFKLAVAYQNVPNVEYRGVDSEIHYGAALFTHIDYDASRIEGHYWTDRKTYGALDLLPKLPSFIRRVCSSFAPGEGGLQTQLV